MSNPASATNQSSTLRKVGKVLLVLGVIALGLLVMIGLVKTKPEPKKHADAAAKVPVVEVVAASEADQRIHVDATGIVQPSQSVVISAEVPGRIASVSDQFVAGARVEAGEALIVMEPERFALAVARAQARLAQARTELALEQGRSDVAQREWALFDRDRGDARQSPLALREPQRQAAQANVAAAEADLREARLNQSRATITAPFGGLVQAETVDAGQYVSPGQSLGQLIGDDVFWVQANVPQDRLAWIALPDAQGNGGATAMVTMPSVTDGSAREGYVVRLLGDLDPQSRMARLIVAVPDPLDGSVPLLVGGFVNVAVTGKTLRQVIRVPRETLLDSNSVWVVLPDDTIAQRTLTIVWRDDDHVYASQGIEPGEQIVRTRLPLAVEGMPVTRQGDAPDASDTPTSSEAGA